MIAKKLLARFDGLSVRNKILAGYASLIAPFLVLVVMAGITSTQALALSRKINETSIPLLEALHAIQHFGIIAIEATNTIALIHALGPDAARRSATGSEAMVTARDAFAAAVRSYGEIDDAQAGADPVFRQNIGFARDDIIRQSSRIARLSAEGASPDVLLGLRDRFERSAADFRSLIGAAIDAERAELASRQARLRVMTWLSAVVVIAVGLAGAALAVVWGLRVSEHIAQPIRRLRDAALRVGDGEEFAITDQARTDDEVGELAAAFRTMVARLKDSMAMLARQERLATLGQLAGSVSHELRNPLGVIRNSLFSLRESIGGDGTGGPGKIVGRIERNIERCDAIVADLLDYARCGELARDTVDVDRWLSTVLDHHVIPPEITLRRELAFGAAMPLDRNRFRQIIINLLDNAIQAITDSAWQNSGAPPGVITVRTELSGPCLQLSVADTGPGIEPATLAKIFEPLFTTKAFGVGLGLPTVRRIVQQHGGSIEAVSEPGRGTTFLVRIPQIVQPEERAA